MLSSLSELLSVQNYIPHGVCLLWQPGLLWLHVLSDATIAIAYYTIPLALVYFVSRRHDLAFRGIFGTHQRIHFGVRDDTCHGGGDIMVSRLLDRRNH